MSGFHGSCITDHWRNRNGEDRSLQYADFEAAAWRGAQRLKKGLVAACYDQLTGRVVIELDCGLEAAALAHPSEIEISPSGQGLYFPMVDADLYLPALLKDLLAYKTRLATPRQNSTGTCGQF